MFYYTYSRLTSILLKKKEKNEQKLKTYRLMIALMERIRRNLSNRLL